MDSTKPRQASGGLLTRILMSRNKCKDIILSLPSRNEWNFPLPLFQYKGFWNFPIYLEGLILAEKQFKARPTDIILCSHPKSGTTWLKALAFAIVTRSTTSTTTSPLLTRSPHDCVTFMELDAAQGVDNRDPAIPLVATHSPYTSLPGSVTTLGCKIVYICREPKDAFLSQWHHMRQQTWFRLLSITFEDAFDMFCQGVFVHGPYWEHALEYWRASNECPERVLFLRYEDMRGDTRSNVKRLAEFMGYPFTKQEEEQGGVMDAIIQLCSLENLKGLEVNKRGKQRPYSWFSSRNELFFRKGEVGDWKSAMTAEMASRLDQIMEHNLSGSGLSFASN